MTKPTPYSMPGKVWLRFGSNWCEGHLKETPGEVPYVPEAALKQTAVSTMEKMRDYVDARCLLDFDRELEEARAARGHANEEGKTATNTCLHGTPTDQKCAWCEVEKP